MKKVCDLLPALLLTTPGQAFAAEPTASDAMLTVDTVWVIVATVLVFIMQAGFALLEASNHRWNLSLVHWQERIDSYLLLPNWDNARFLSIAADMRVAYGDEALAAELQGWFYKRVRDSRFLHGELADRAVAVTRLGAFRVDRWGENEGSIDVKYGGCLQIVEAVRMFALAHEVTAHGTRGRIEELVRRGVWEENFASEVQSALEVVVGYRTWGNYINPSTLSPVAAHVLKQALKTAHRLQKWTAKRFPRP